MMALSLTAGWLACTLSLVPALAATALMGLCASAVAIHQFLGGVFYDLAMMILAPMVTVVLARSVSSADPNRQAPTQRARTHG